MSAETEGERQARMARLADLFAELADTGLMHRVVEELDSAFRRGINEGARIATVAYTSAGTARQGD